jgi:hypothetical protein
MAPNTWRRNIAHKCTHGWQRVHLCAVILAFMILSFATAHVYRKEAVPEALQSSEASCPKELPIALSPHISSISSLYNTTITITRTTNTFGMGRLYDISAVTAQHITPAQSTHCVAVRVPPAVLKTLQHIHLAALPSRSPGMDQTSFSQGHLDGSGTGTPDGTQLCVCASSDTPTTLPAPHPSTHTTLQCPLTCEAALQHLALNDTQGTYGSKDWYLLTLPEKVDAGRVLALSWTSHPSAAFLESSPYALPHCEPKSNQDKSVGGAEVNVTAELCSSTTDRVESALFGDQMQFMPHVLAQGADTAGYVMHVVVPSDMQVLWANLAEHSSSYGVASTYIALVVSSDCELWL